ncbi:MAG: hypothetical protein ACR5K5_03920 [Wolbachia sp.]
MCRTNRNINKEDVKNVIEKIRQITLCVEPIEILIKRSVKNINEKIRQIALCVEQIEILIKRKLTM